MVLVCVHDGATSDELVAKGDKTAKDKAHVMFLRTDNYWQRKWRLFN